jgi:nucleotide-binding universal stress UspA family protein
MFSTVAVGVDGSRTAGEAVKMAAELALRFDAKLVLLSAYKHADDVAASLARTEEGLREVGVRCTTLIAEGDPAEVLVSLAQQCEADVLVVGNKGMERRVLGSIPNTVTHKAGCSVLVVKTT